MAKKKNPSARKVTTMRLPEALLTDLAVDAAHEGRSRSNHVERLLTDAMEKRKANAKRRNLREPASAPIFG